MNKVTFNQCWQCKTPLARLSGECIDEDSLSTQDMADIEDSKPVLFDEAKHKKHVCHEVSE